MIALELSLGAAVAGPFDIAERDLTKLIQKVVDSPGMPPARGATVH